MINNDADFDASGQAIKELLAKKKKTLELWNVKKSNANTEHKRIVGLEMAYTQPIDKRIAEIKEAMCQYFDTEVADRRNEMILWRDARVRDLRKAGMDETADKLEEAPLEIQEPSSECVSIKRKLGYVVVAQEFVGYEFMKVDESKIRKAVQEFGEMAEKMVGGIKVEETTVISINRGQNV